MTSTLGSAPAATTTDIPWWREAVIYQVYIRSFADGDGDGVGDLAGIRSRLPYLRDLGVDALWITPFYPSPMADGGYDVADYRDIEPVFGTLAEADALIAEAHAAGLRVLVDIVPNHSSDEHPWFQAALAAGPGSPERARYLFRPGRGRSGDQPPNDWRSVFGGPAWQRVPDGEWYLHIFDVKQPDFDWTNPDVIAEFLDVLRFWLDRDVDGFRIDVAHGLAKDPELPDLGVVEDEEVLERQPHPNHPYWDQDAVHEVYRGWREVLDSYDGERMLVAEAWVDFPERLALYLRPDELHTAFNFDFVKAKWDAASLRAVIDECIAQLAGVGAPTTWVLSNHDIVREVTRYGGGRDGLRRARAAALLMLSLPGGAYIYQGQELGLPEIEDLPEELLADPTWERSGHTRRGRDGCRVPIPWTTGGESYGFGPGGSWLPQPASWSELSVQAQQDTSGSTLELFRTALRLRRAEPSLGEGALRWEPSPEGAIVFRRFGAGGEPGVVVALNCSDAPVEIGDLGELLVASESLADPRVLSADTAAWFRLP